MPHVHDLGLLVVQRVPYRVIYVNDWHRNGNDYEDNERYGLVTLVVIGA